MTPAIPTMWDGEEVASAAFPLLGTRVRDARPVPCFAGNQVFEVLAGDRPLILKMTSSEAVRSEAAVLSQLSSRRVPVPVIEACDPTGEVFGRPVLALGRLAGQPLDGPSPELSHAGGLLRAVHDVEVEGFGPVSVSDRDVLVGSHESWAATIMDRTSKLGPVVEAGLIEASLARQVPELVEDHVAATAPVGSARLLHGDFHPRHVFASEGTVTGIIDWGDASGGDPVYDLARVFHSGLMGHTVERGWSLLDSVRTGYGPLDRDEADLRRDVLAYAAAFAAWSMVGEHEGGAPWPPWWPLQRAALRSILDELQRQPR